MAVMMTRLQRRPSSSRWWWWLCLVLHQQLGSCVLAAGGGDLCPPQPALVDEMFDLMRVDAADRACIFRAMADHDMAAAVGSLASRVHTQEKNAVPDSQGWSRCRDCAWDRGRFLVVRQPVAADGNSDGRQAADPRANVTGTARIDLSWSLWGEFFHWFRNDQIHADVVKVADVEAILQRNHVDGRGRSYYVDRPVYILPMITLHVGHILIDLLEQVYWSMMKTYGKVRRDALLILDVANSDEREVLQEKIYVNTYNPEVDTFGAIVRLFTDMPIFAADNLFGVLNARDDFVLFRDLHVGLDVADTYYYQGYAMHPHVFPSPSENREVQLLAARYRNFTAFVHEGFRQTFASHGMDTFCTPELLDAHWGGAVGAVGAGRPGQQRTGGPLRVLFVQREKNRAILDVPALVREVESRGGIASVNELANVAFSEQLCVFDSTDVLVATAGTAIHNILFMRPSSAVVILMQAGWCDWAWMYANQAVLLGVQYHILCAPDITKDADGASARDAPVGPGHAYTFDLPAVDAEARDRFHWTRKFWVQGPRMSKSDNVTVNVTAFAAVAAAVVERFRRPPQSSVVGGEVGDRADAHLAPGRARPLPPRPLSTPPLQLVITEIRVEVVEFGQPVGPDVGAGAGPNGISGTAWKLAIMGEFFSDGHKGTVGSIVQSLPHLAICVHSLRTDSSPWCDQLERFNYYSDLFLTVTEPAHLLHMWLQVSQAGGKIKGSDVYLAIDATLPSAGLDLHAKVVGMTITGDVEMEPVATASGTVVDASGRVVDTATGLPLPRKATSVTVHVGDRYALQLATIDFCRAHDLTDLSCGYFSLWLTTRALRQYMSAQRNLPAIQRLPTPEKPFVFVHIEKTGGTTLREFVSEAADRLGLPHFIPCHGDIHCVTLSLRDALGHTADGRPVTRHLPNVSVVAGHFFWDVWQDLPSAAVDPNPARGPTKAVPPCFVMARHPLERAISYYYQRCYESPQCVGHMRRINDLTVEEMFLVATSERQGKHRYDNRTLVVIDEGMEDAACRAIANAKATTGLIAGVDEVRVPPPLTEEETRRALGNLDHCVVGVLERWEETKAVMEYWFPWLDFSVDSHRRKMHIYSGKETARDLRPEIRDVLQSVSQCDLKLYARAVDLFEQQLQVVSASFGGMRL